MSLIFIASAWEEFIRDVLGQCVPYLGERYVSRPEHEMHKLRNRYWEASLDKLQFSKSILGKGNPKAPDASTLAVIKQIVRSVQGFVVDGDPRCIEPLVIANHPNNFRYDAVQQLARRFGIDDLLGKAAASASICQYFGQESQKDSVRHFKKQLDDFYVERNDTVHSLGNKYGVATDVIFRYTKFFELAAEVVCDVLKMEMGRW
jgi:hypothetical protein